MKTPKIKYRIAALTLVLMLLVLVWERQPYRFLVRGQLFCELCAGEYRQRAGGRRGGPLLHRGTGGCYRHGQRPLPPHRDDKRSADG